MRAPVVCRHDGPLAVLANLKVSKTYLLPDPAVDRLRTHYLFPLQPEPTANLLRTVLAVDDEPPYRSLHLIGELQVVSPDLHLLFVLHLSQLPSVPVIPAHVAVPPDLAAHRTRTDSSSPILKLIGV